MCRKSSTTKGGGEAVFVRGLTNPGSRGIIKLIRRYHRCIGQRGLISTDLRTKPHKRNWIENTGRTVYIDRNVRINDVIIFVQACFGAHSIVFA